MLRIWMNGQMGHGEDEKVFRKGNSRAEIIVKHRLLFPIRVFVFGGISINVLLFHQWLKYIQKFHQSINFQNILWLFTSQLCLICWLCLLFIPNFRDLTLYKFMPSQFQHSRSGVFLHLEIQAHGSFLPAPIPLPQSLLAGGREETHPLHHHLGQKSINSAHIPLGRTGHTVLL